MKKKKVKDRKTSLQIIKACQKYKSRKHVKTIIGYLKKYIFKKMTVYMNDKNKQLITKQCQIKINKIEIW